MSTSNEEVLVANEYKHLNILKDGKFIQGALVNSAKVETKEGKVRYFASLEGHKIIDTGFVLPDEKYSHEIVEDNTRHQPVMMLSDIKVAYKLALKAALDESYSFSERQTIGRLVSIFGGFVKRSLNGKSN